PEASIESLQERRFWLQCERAYTWQPIYQTCGRLMAVELLTADPYIHLTLPTIVLVFTFDPLLPLELKYTHGDIDNSHFRPILADTFLNLDYLWLFFVRHLYMAAFLYKKTESLLFCGLCGGM
ncbi:hypothetical protein C7U69_24390, partial [Escherichia coli]